MRINYEDPPWDYAGDVEDRTDSNWRLRHPDVRHRRLIPKPGRIYLEYEVDDASGQPSSPLALLKSLVDAHAAQGNPCIFRVISEAGYFSILPAQVRNAQGHWVEAFRILDRTGRDLWPGGVGANFMILERTHAGANNEPAWVALHRIVNEPAYGQSGSTAARRMVWHLYYQQGWDWALNLHAAPAQQAAPDFIAPAPAAFRFQNTPAKWFDRSAEAQTAPTGVTPAQLAPHFTREGVIPFHTLRPRMLAPGIIATIYGGRFSRCDVTVPPNGPYPEEACGVRVLVAVSPPA